MLAALVAACSGFAVIQEYEVTGELVTEMAFEEEYGPRLEPDGSGGLYVLSSIGFTGGPHRLRHVAPDLEEVLSGERIDEPGLGELHAMTVTEDGLRIVGAAEDGPVLVSADVDGRLLSTEVRPERAIPSFTGVRELEDGTVLVARTSVLDGANAAFVARWQ